MEYNLISSFNEALNKRFACKKEMAYTIAEILDIEVESAYRRVSGKVNFTVKEIGILSGEMNLSLDSMLFGNTAKTPIVFRMASQGENLDMDTLCETMEESVGYHDQLKSETSRIGQIFDSLPVETFCKFPTVMKFMYFKWGHYNTGSQEFDKFETWEIPERLLKVTKRLRDRVLDHNSLLYIWDNTLLWNLVNEINHFIEIGSLTPGEAALIKNELTSMLEHLKRILKDEQSNNCEIEFYVTNFNISVSGFYVLSDNVYIAGIRSAFLQSYIHHDYETGYKLHQWIESMKKFSSLISGSGEKQRAIFFKEQYEHLDRIRCGALNPTEEKK